MTLTVGTLVRVLPEALPDSGRSTLCNARVVSTGDSVTFLSLTDEFNPDSFSFTLEADEANALPRITQEEVEAASTIWHRQFVVFAEASSGRWVHGQVYGLVFPLLPQVQVATAFGMKTVLLGDDDLPIMTVFPVVAILLRFSRFHANVPGIYESNRRAQLALPQAVTSKSPSELEDLHRLVFSRVTGDDTSQPDEVVEAAVPNVPDILHDLVSTREIPSPAEVCVIINPYTGQPNHSTVLHVVLQVHFSGRDLPKELINCIGQRFSEDPRSTQPNNIVIVPRHQLHNQTTSTDSEIPLLNQPAVPDTLTLPEGYLSPRSRITSSVDNTPPIPTTPFHLHLMNPPPSQVASFRPSNTINSTAPILSEVPPIFPSTTPEFVSDANERLHNIQDLRQFVTNPPPAMLSAVPSYRSAEIDLTQASIIQAQEFMLQHRRQQRDTSTLTLDEAWEAYDTTPKVTKMFKVSKDEFEFHWWLSSHQYRGLTPTQFLTDCMARFPVFTIIPHPAVLMFHFRLAFGSGQLSLWHFRKASQFQLETWNDREPLSLTTFPAKLTPPAAQQFQTLAELRDALTNIHKVACFYGSATYQQFTHAAKHFFDHSLEKTQLTDADVNDLLRWYNLQFQEFATTLYMDIHQHRAPPLHVVSFHCFDTSSSKYADLLLNLQGQRTLRMHDTIRSQVAEQVIAALGTSAQYGASIPSAETSRPRGNRQHNPSAMPQHLQRAIPKQRGVSCCLRALTTQGCLSRLVGDRCGSGSLRKAHFVPTSLPADVKAWMVNIKHWTIKPELANL